MKPKPESGGEFVITRVVDAPRGRVWKAWTEERELKAWFGPKEFERFYSKLDFRVGGGYHYGLRSSGGVEVWGKWTFREIVAPERFTFLMAFSDKDGGLGRHPMAPQWPQQMTATILFAEMGGKTLVTVKSVPHEATKEEIKVFRAGFASMTEGWTGTLDQLATFCAK